MRRDQEPEIEQVDESWAGKVCQRCGLDGHKSELCPHVNVMTLRTDSEDNIKRRRQVKAVR